MLSVIEVNLDDSRHAHAVPVDEVSSSCLAFRGANTAVTHPRFQSTYQRNARIDDQIDV